MGTLKEYMYIHFVADNLPSALTKTKTLYPHRANALRVAVIVSDGLMADITTQGMLTINN
jgi:hypothetical protein